MKQLKGLLPFLLAVVMTLPCGATEATYYKGLDVSVYQGDITFSEVFDAGYEAVYIRAGQGSDITDSYFKDNYQKAADAGLAYGFYYYVTATSVDEAQTQAKRFASLISGTAYTLRPAMDFESFGDLTDDAVNAIALAFLSTLATETGVTPALYSDANNVEQLWSSSVADYPLWVAAYENLSAPENYTLPDTAVWSSWSGYQYTDALSVDGISGDVDGDLFTATLFLSDADTTSTDTATTSTTYTIKPGDTLWALAKRFDTTVEALASYNAIQNPDCIYSGAVLKLPSTATDSYTIQSGDTLYQIALTHGTTVQALATLNNMTQTHWIYPGHTLLIPAN